MTREYHFFIVAILLAVAAVLTPFPDMPDTPLSGRAVTAAHSSITIDPGVIVYYDTFNGSTTDFLYLTDAQLANITSMRLDKLPFSSIVWDGPLDITADASDSILDLDSLVTITTGSVSIDASLASLDSPATITFHRLTYTNPRALLNGTLCPPSTCSFLSYTGGSYAFTATGFTGTYTVEETPSTQTAPGTGGGGGRTPPADVIPLPAPVEPVTGVSFSSSLLTLTLAPGQSSSETIILSNIGTEPLDLTIISELTYLTLNKNSVRLLAEDATDIKLTITIPSDAQPGTYSGRLVIRSGEFSRSMPILLTIARPNVPLSITPAIPSTILPQSQNLDVRLILKGTGEATLTYGIWNIDGQQFGSTTETVTIDGETLFERFLPLTALPPGDYFLRATLTIGGESSSAGQAFVVIKDQGAIETPGTYKEPDKTAVIAIQISWSIILLTALLFAAKWKPRR